MGARALLMAAVACAGCSGFRTPAEDVQDADAAPFAEAGPHPDGPRPSLEQAPSRDAPRPGKGCREIPLPCLDPAPSTVIEVPGESTAEQAFGAAQSGDTIQIRGLALGPGWSIPPYVTLRGCAGAKIAKGIRFAGSAGVLEGFEIAGQIVANTTGSYIVRFNRFVGGGDALAGVSARSVDGLVAASVTALVEANWFETRAYGVEASTKYDTLVHEVQLTVRNNIFSGVESPLSVSEGGLVGKIKAVVEQNTFHQFKTAIALWDLGQPTVLSGNLFSIGETGIQASSPFELRYCLGWQLTKAHSTPPLAGTMATGDPRLIDPAGGDFRPGTGSAALDAVPQGTVVPSEDYLGCPRPGVEGKADIGAIEAQQ